MNVTATLNTIGRAFLSFQGDNYTLLGIFLTAIVLIFVYWRKFMYGEWPTITDCLVVVLSIFTILTGITVAVAFLLTKPPAVDLLPPSTLLIVGLANLIVGFAYGFPKLWFAFNPPAPDPPRARPSAPSAQPDRPDHGSDSEPHT
jgi:hypothetical protein